MRSLLALGLGGLLGLVALLALLPAPRAALCPGCFGLVRATDTLWVEAAMPAPDRLRLIAQIAAAKAQVARALGPTRGRLRLLACQTAACDRRLGGRGGGRGDLFLWPRCRRASLAARAFDDDPDA
ncbi:hypothetical protein ACTTAM_10420 [Rhodobacter capsulatus]|uniref:hypothetical protein n=1 Tax=Rhodobacter capsulatus TaxID=1061 RepID=UPI0040288AD0